MTDTRGSLLLWLPLLGVVFGCAPVRSSRYVLPETTETGSRKTAPPPGYAGQLTWQHYLPDAEHPEYMPIRYVRVNFHVMNSRDSSHNFKPAAGKDISERVVGALKCGTGHQLAQLALAGRHQNPAQTLPLCAQPATSAGRRRFLFPLR